MFRACVISFQILVGRVLAESQTKGSLESPSAQLAVSRSGILRKEA